MIGPQQARGQHPTCAGDDAKENEAVQVAGGKPPAPAGGALPGSASAGLGGRKRTLVEQGQTGEAVEPSRELRSPFAKRWRQESPVASPFGAHQLGAQAALPHADCQHQASAPTSAAAVPAAGEAAEAELPGGGAGCQQQSACAASCRSLEAARWEEPQDEGQAEDAGAEQADGAEMPDWCDRPLMLELPDGGEVDAFSYLPGHPLVALACEGQAKLLAKVLEMGGDPDAVDSRGYTALHLACRHARLACVRCLLDAGAAQLPDRAGQTPASLAAAAGHDDVLAVLQHHEEVQAALAEQRRQEEQQGREEEDAAACAAPSPSGCGDAPDHLHQT